MVTWNVEYYPLAVLENSSDKLENSPKIAGHLLFKSYEYFDFEFPTS